MFMQTPQITASQVMSFADKYGDETEVFVANVATSSYRKARDSQLVFLSTGPKHNDGCGKIRIDVIYTAISDEAIKGTGQHFELYEHNMCSLLINYVDHLPDSDRQLFIEYIESKGHQISSSEYLEDVSSAYDDTMTEVRSDQH
ncbi:hypothetical protein [Thalassospira sp. CH_XMU1420-2]|uniref:hypothetical protein n=1 Tax=Thalassospira sp. CH_XMU1420-2 TaxID=3107769 RepID=UPI0030088780